MSDGLKESPPPVAIDMPERKKKKKRKNNKREEEIILPPAAGSTSSREEQQEEEPQADKDTSEPYKKKRKMEEEEQQVDIDTSETPKKKKEKKKIELRKESVVMVKTTHNRESHSLVPMETSNTGTKAKKKKNDDGRVVAMSQEEVIPGNNMTTEQRKKGGGRLREKEDGVMADERDQLLDELQEFIPNVKTKSIDQINKLLRYDLQRFRSFKCQGVSLRRGRCSQEENELIMQNISDFLALTGISSAHQLLFPKRFKESPCSFQTYYVTVSPSVCPAEGIPRTCQQVYTRVKEELRSLVKLQNLHGNNWRTISQKMGRSIYSLEKRFAHIGKHLHLTFTADVILADSFLSRCQLCNNLPWKEISLQVGTRSWTQCRLKWSVHLLAQVLYWCATSVCVQKAFHRLKVSKVPHWTKLSYGEIIDFLQLEVVPCLKEQLRKVLQQELQREAQQDSRFQLKDIFSDDEDGFTELDNS
uniref:HTH myb-type domain-containing protein n=1 Tax=Mola mola TaxID=94237 RepID=A0A3Q4BZ46_MOLML